MAKETYFSLALAVGAVGWTVVQSMYPVISPIVGWPIAVILFIGAILLFIIGIRKKEGQKEFLVPTIDFHAWAFGISGYRGYPKEPDEKWWLNLEISANLRGRPIDTLDLVIEGDYIHVNLPCKFGGIFNAYFEVTKWRDTGKHQVELIAKVGNELISSGRKTIPFDMEPFGRHLISL
jgi:hypothetical protein